jgi:hypothetical protein
MSATCTNTNYSLHQSNTSFTHVRRNSLVCMCAQFWHHMSTHESKKTRITYKVQACNLTYTHTCKHNSGTTSIQESKNKNKGNTQSTGMPKKKIEQPNHGFRMVDALASNIRRNSPTPETWFQRLLGCITRRNHPRSRLMGASLPHTQQFRACRIYCGKSLMHPLQITEVQQNIDAPTPWTQAARHGMRKRRKGCHECMHRTN